MINSFGKVAAITVTYNRKELLFDNIQSVLNQNFDVDSIIIVDNNSSDGSKEFITSKFYNNKLIDYIFLNENIGGAGGFYTGCKYAYEHNFDWVILMDDDGKPYDIYTFENLFKLIDFKHLNSSDRVMINSLVLCDENKLSFNLFDIDDTTENIKNRSIDKISIENKINPFNGTLISKGLMQAIGFPNKDFFIKGDEHDYLCRAMNANAYISTAINSKYYHPKVTQNGEKILRFFNKKILFFIEAPWKEYYRSRNYTYSFFRNNKKNIARKQFLLRLFGVIICKCNKLQSIRMIIKGYRDGKLGKLGNSIKP